MIVFWLYDILPKVTICVMYQHFHLQITTIKTRPMSLLTLGIAGTHLIASPCCRTSWVCNFSLYTCIYACCLSSWNSFGRSSFLTSEERITNVQILETTCFCRMNMIPLEELTPLDFPGGSVEFTCRCRKHRFHPWSGKIPHSTEQLSPHSTTIEPVL